MATNKQTAFITEYLYDFNATQAAIRAGYSPKTAYSIGHELLKKPEIQEAIQAEIDQRAMKADEILLRLSDIARGDLADFMDVTSMGFTIDLTNDEKSERVAHPQTKLIKKIKQKVTTYMAKNESQEDRETIETEIELYSAHEALRDLAKYHGMFVDRTDITSGGEVIKVVLKDDNSRD